MGKRKICIVILIFSLSFLVTPNLNSYTHKRINWTDFYKIRPINKEFPNNYQGIGYFIDSTPFSNAVYYILKYDNFGNSLIPFIDFTDLSLFSMVIVPYKLNWSQEDINSLSNFVNEGGIAFITVNIPKDLLNLELTLADETYWIHPTDQLVQSIGGIHNQIRPISYHIAYITLQQTYVPFDTVRDLYYISKVNEDNYEILHEVSLSESGIPKLGLATVAKNIGLGKIIFTTVPYFDFLGQSATGGPTVPATSQGALIAGRISKAINQLLQHICVNSELLVPIRWHTPDGKIACLISRDDVDGYYSTTVQKRGLVDQLHGIHTIFYELRDDIPQSDWETVLNVSTSYPCGYHIPGYHRHTNYEPTAANYYNVLRDIELETNQSVYFECHHGGGSGFFGQDYVRTAIEATNNLNHFVVYTSGEGGHENDYLEPYLYDLRNETVIPAKNYYSLPKMTTIDSLVNSNDYNSFKDRILNSFFRGKHIRHGHWLLHSQNVPSTLTNNYNNFLTQYIDPLYDYYYTDPINFVKQNLAITHNISTLFKSNKTDLDLLINANQDINGYTLTIPINSDLYLSSLKLDGLDINTSKIKIFHEGNYRLLLFDMNISKGTHNVILKLDSNPRILPNDQDNDGIMDYFEVVFFKTSPTASDTDLDGNDDGDEVFILDTDPLLFDINGSTNLSSLSNPDTSTDTSSTTSNLITSDTSSISSNKSSTTEITTIQKTTASYFSIFGFLLIFTVFRLIFKRKSKL